MLLPGEEVEVTLTATIDSEIADALNCGREVLLCSVDLLTLPRTGS
jgi:hypothetical protein